MPIKLESLKQPADQRLRAFLDKDRTGNLYRRVELEAMFGFTRSTIDCCKKRLHDYWLIASVEDDNGQHKMQTLWGKPKLIHQAKEALSCPRN